MSIQTTLYVEDSFVPRPATDATNVPPGTQARVQVYAERVERGEAVFAAEDRRDLEGCSNPRLLRKFAANQMSEQRIRVVSTSAFRRHH